MGKPLGMGAVKLKIDKLSLDNRQNRYEQLFTHNNQWELGERLNTTTQKQNCIKAFETYILQNIHQDDKQQANSFDEIPRIKMLLTMLQCDSLYNSTNADYMTLESQKHQKRHVLPTPLQVGKPIKKKVELPKKKLTKSNLDNTSITKAWERPKPPKK